MDYKKLFTFGKKLYNLFFGYSDIHKMVRKFHLKAGQPIQLIPGPIPDDRVHLRAKLIMEEAFETVGAMYGNHAELAILRSQTMALMVSLPVKVDLPEVADGCADLDYVVEGTRLEFGINGLPVAKVVQAANMAKFGPGSWMREDGKQMKPPGWEAPDVAAELKRQGWVAPPPSLRSV